MKNYCFGIGTNVNDINLYCIIGVVGQRYVTNDNNGVLSHYQVVAEGLSIGPRHR